MFEQLGGAQHVLLTHQDDLGDAAACAKAFGEARSAPFATELISGDSVLEFLPGVVALPVPGHTRGSVMFEVQGRSLFTGDSLFWSRGLQTLQAHRERCWFSWEAQTRSLATLKGRAFEWARRPRAPRRLVSAEVMEPHTSGDESAPAAEFLPLDSPPAWRAVLRRTQSPARAHVRSPMGRSRQGLFAFAVSALAHVAVVKFLDERPAAPQSPPPLTPTALIWVEAEVPPHAPTVSHEGARSTRAPSVGAARTSKRAPAVTATPDTAEKAPTTSPQPASSSDRATPNILTPRDDVLGTDVAEAAPTGRTLRPEDEPSDAERLAEEAARVHDRVDGWARQTLRRARVANGIVDPHYSDLQRELAAATDEVPDLIGLDDPKAVATALKDAWQAGAERYGKTGAPYDTPPGWNPAIEQPESLMRQAQAGSPEMQNFVQFLSAGARLQEFADGRAGTALVTTVALTQAPDGAVLELRLQEPSGVKPFDTWVMNTARARLESVRFDAGLRERGFTSLWQFTGRVSFMKKASAPTARTLATQIPLMALSALTGGRVPIALGRFDEVTGTVETLDLSSPHFECTVTLLEAD